MENLPPDQKDELDALKAIYDEDFTEISMKPPCFMIRLADLDVSTKGVSPTVELPMRSAALTAAQQKELLQHLHQTAEENLDMSMVYALVEAGKDWLNTHPPDLPVEEQQNSNTVEELGESAVDGILTEPTVSGGRWDFVIGLIGKPSAGKSTFFNAATTFEQAKTGAHPFTTIEPNIGKAFYTMPCPCAKLHSRCNAAHGHNYAGDRYVPVLLKDVAGLVPGACDGKGRGNRFLNDLLDADVLAHIVDMSGCTNEKGEETVGYDPALDVSWLQQELQRWIFDNIKDKWDAIKRRPAKLIDMFTGYHANKSVIHAAFQAAGIDNKQLSIVAGWDDQMLQKLVDCFLRIRFPVFLVLNKADTPAAGDNISRVQERFPSLCSLPVSARSECMLQQLARDGHIEYNFGQGSFQRRASSSENHHQQQQQLCSITDGVFKRDGGTNVQRALSEAVRLRTPAYAFPVQCLDTLTSVHKYRDAAPGVLRDCVCLRPRTSVEELYTALLHYPLQLAAGDFIRAECYCEDGKKRIVRKDEEIDSSNCIIRIFTNRKVSQVKSRD